MILWLLFLILIPITAHVFAKKHALQYRGTIVGASLGLVASPVSLGLYATYFLGPYGIVTGMLGLVLVLWHVAPGYYICSTLGVVPAGTVIKGTSQLAVEVSNGIFWGSIYGMLGYGLDRWRFRRKAL